MRSLIVAVLVLFGTLTVGVSRATAAPITVSVGSFSWASDDFFGDSFTLANNSAVPGLAGDFTELSLFLTGDYDLDGTTDEEFFDPFLPATLGAVDPGNSYNGTAFAGPFSAVRLQFRYAAVGLPELLFDQTFLRTEGGVTALIDYTYDRADPDPNPNPVPEPSSLVLLAAGAAGAMARRRMARTT